MGKKIKKQSTRRKSRQALVFEELEPRLLLSADLPIDLPAALAPDRGDDDPVSIYEEITTIAVNGEQHTAHELVFVDTDTPDYQILVDDLLGNSGEDRLIEVVLLDNSSDGIAQITQTLSDYSELDAVHIISHGSEGSIDLGGTQLEFDTLLANTTAIQGWADAFSDSGDLLVYGCNLTASEDGQALVNSLARLTGADVAASDDLTGQTSLGGDWVLEYQTGSIETTAAVSSYAQGIWNNVLETYTVINTNDSGAGSLRQLILDANANAGADTINFNITGTGVHTINVASALPTINEALIINGLSEPDYAGTPVVRIDGAAAGFSGLSIGAGGGSSTIQGLMITGFTVDGINVASGANNVTIADNWIGTAGTGTTGVGNSGVGNTDDGIDIAGSNAIITRNVITNSGDEGIDIVGSGVTGHVIQGNYIGLDPDGASGSGNTDVGIAIISGSGNTIGGNTAAARNVISNNYEGIEINTSNNVFQGNYIGTDAGGTLDRGNRSDDGVEIQSGATGNLIGGTANGAGNLIAFNALSGVNVFSGSNNAILGNEIHSNSGLGINVGTAGVSLNDANDADAGANDLQNFPVLTAAVTNTVDTITIDGSLNSTANSYLRIEFFASATADGSGYGEGETYLGFVNVVTDGSGNANFSAVLSATVANGAAISATTTRSDVTYTTVTDTSEFSQVIAATSPVINFTISTTPSISEDLAETATITVTLGGDALAGGTTASVDITASGSALSGTDYDNFVTAIAAAAGATAGVTFDGTDTLTFDSTFNGGSGLGAFAFTVDAIDDASVEGTETIIATLSNPGVTGGTATFGTFSDSFTEASNTPVTAHTPDSGLVWTKVFDNSTYGEAFIDAALGVIQGGSGVSQNNTGQAYTAGPAPTGVDQTISFTLSAIETDNGTKPVGLFGRSTDNDNFYYLRILPNDNAQDSISLWKMVGGVATQLDTIDVTIAAGDTFKLEITDGAKKAFHNGTEVLSSTDNALTAAGTWGFFIGDFNGVSGHYRTTWNIDNFLAEDSSSVVSASTDITETDVNDAPTASNNTVTTNEDTTYTFVATDFNFSDIDGDSLSQIQITTLETAGSLELSGVAVTLNQVITAAEITAGNLTFTPVADANGTAYDAFAFRVHDGTLYSAASYTMTIDVTSVNDAPTAQDKTIITPEDTTYTFTLSDFGYNDVDGDPIALVRILPIYANVVELDGVGLGATTHDISVTDINNGKLTFVPPVNITGTADFMYFVVNDGTVDSVFKTIAANITPVNDAPVANNDPGVYSTTIQDLSPLGYWRLGETAGAANDLGSSANNCIYNGGTLGQTGGLFGDSDTAVQFDGSSDYIEIAHSNDYLLDNGTIQLWFNANNVTNGDLQHLFSKDAQGFVNGGHVSMYLNTSGQLEVRLQSATTDYIVNSTSPVSAGDWHHAAVSFGANGLGLYLDGVLVDSDGYTGGLGTSSGGSGNVEGIAIGAGTQNSTSPSINPVNQMFTGSIDEVALFGQQLNAQTIQRIYDAGANQFRVNENGSLNLSATSGVLANDTDVDGDSLTVAEINGSAIDVGTQVALASGALVTLNSDGSMDYDPNAQFESLKIGETATDTFSYTVSDGNGETDIATVTITIMGENDASTAANNTVVTTEDTAYVFTLADFGYSDIDGDSLSQVQITTLESVGSLQLSGVDVVLNQVITAADISGGNLTFMPVADANGASYDSFAFRVHDGTVYSATSYTMTVDVTPVNDAPTAANNTVATNEDTAYMFTLADFGFSDVDGDSLSQIQITSLESAGSLQLSGADVVLNQVITAADITAGNLTFIPAADANGFGYDSFAFRVHDGTAYSVSSYTMTVDVTAVNDAPTAANNTVATNEDTAYVFTLADFGFSDIDGDSLSQVQITTLEANGSLQLSGADVVLNQVITAPDITAGNLTFMPAADANGAGYDSFGFRVHDGTAYSVSSYTLTVDVTPVNDAPTAANNTVVTNEDTAYVFTLADFGFSDIDGDSLSQVQITTLEANGSLQLSGADVVLNQVITAPDITAGNLTFMPAADANGAGYDSFGFRVHDGTAYSVSSYTLTVDVTPVNDAPTAANNTVVTNEDTAYVFTLADFGFSDVDGDSLSQIQVTSLESAGSLQLSGADVVLNQVITAADITAGNLTFMPAADANGAGYDNFGFRAHDGTAYSVSSYTMTVDVTAVNDAPTAANNTITTSEDTAYMFTLADFGFSDVDGDSLSQIQITSLESAGSLQLSGADVVLNQVITAADITAGNLTFMPAVDANGTGYDSFGFRVHDGTAYSVSSYTLTVDVTPVNDAPTAANKTVVTNEETAYVFTLVDFGFGDIDGDSLSQVQITTLEANGSLQLSGADVVLNQVITAADITAGNLTFMPAVDANGAGYDSFGFRVHDGTAYSASPNTMTVDVTPANDAPTAANNTVTTNEDTAHVFTLADFGFSDIDGDSLSQIQITTLESAGSLQLSGVDVVLNQVITAADITAGNLTFTPAADANGAGYDSFGFRVHDGTVYSVASYTMTFDVTPVNDAPIHSVPAAQSTSGNTPLIFSSLNANGITVADPDAGGAAMEVTLSVSNGTLSLSGTSGLSFSAGNGSSDTAMTFTGAAADINTALNGLSFQADAGYDGMAVVQIITDDLGNVGTGGALNALDRVNITVTASAATGNAQNTLPPLDELILQDTLESPTPGPVSTPDNRVNVTPAAEQASEVASLPAESVSEPASAPVVDPLLGSGRGVSTQADISLPGLVPLFDQDRQPHDDDRPSSVRLIGHVIRQGLVDPFTYAKMLNPLQPDAAIWESIEAMMEQMDGRDGSWYSDDQVLTTTTATGLTVSFTVGYVSWLLRAGYLSASLLSVLPLWREFDPLPVLATTQKKKRKSTGREKDSRETNNMEPERLFSSSPSPEPENNSNETV